MDLERPYGLTGEQIFHGELAIDQLLSARPLLGWAPYLTPVRNLFLCGAGAHPGVTWLGCCANTTPMCAMSTESRSELIFGLQFICFLECGKLVDTYDALQTLRRQSNCRAVGTRGWH